MAESMWCYPQEGSFKMKLRQVRNNYDKWKKKADVLQKWILENFEDKKMKESFIKAIRGESAQKIEAAVGISAVEIVEYD